jgi:putative ABC transport system substrate-binding protein
MISRRTFVATVTGGLLSAPLAAGAQRASGPHRIGWLSASSSASGLPNLDALRAGLRELGYVEGQNITIEVRWADGRLDRLPQLAAELVRLPVHVLCTEGSPASGAAKQATSTIPIVFASVAFPDQSGLVTNYARPGGNITGVAFIGPEYGKRLELLKEASPRLARVALIYNPDNPASVLAFQETERWAASLGVKLEPHKLRGADDVERIFGALVAKRPDALMTTADSLIVSQRARIVDFATKHRLLSMYPTKDFVDAGGLMFYGASIPEMYRHAAGYVGKILKGASPGELPVEQPIKFDMVINLKTARSFGLSIPRSLLLRADRVIE